ncbi:DNA ligase (ATP) [Pseudoalteromonas ulvae UL12]|nr:DNA ligase [Pseudoalteromonas ulvae]MBE0362695.1 DNA ligase (ATP) [Pseudoalteromonas ulvae UL12]
MYLRYRMCVFYLLVILTTHFSQASAPQVQLAKTYQASTDVTEYFISEKYDGIRAIWDGQQLKTRSGNLISAPSWFTEHLPNVWLDGELWSKRNDFEFISQTVRDRVPNDIDWQKISYMIFDAPDLHRPFSERYEHYLELVSQIDQPFIVAVEQRELSSNRQLQQLLKKVTAEGAEGLMLQRKLGIFTVGRNDNLIKLKPYMDAEAHVIAHLPGKGKYHQQLGALLVRTRQGIEFKIGTGFSDSERKNPPKIGDEVTFRYHGVTKNGVPRFASYLRTRSKQYQ